MRKGLTGLVLVVLMFGGEALGTPHEPRGPRLGQSDESQLSLTLGFVSRAISRGDARTIVGSIAAETTAKCDSVEAAVRELIGTWRAEGLKLIPGLAVEESRIEGNSAVVVCSARPILVRQDDRTIVECGRTTETIVFVRCLDAWKMANEEWLVEWLRGIRDRSESNR